jgi:hypothetical protein
LDKEINGETNQCHDRADQKDAAESKNQRIFDVAYEKRYYFSTGRRRTVCFVEQALNLSQSSGITQSRGNFARN